MNAKTVKGKKKKEISSKSIVFWSFIGVIVLVLLTLLVIRIFQRKDITSYDKVPEVSGSEIYTQSEENYFVLFYDFAESEAMESFDKTMFQYLTYRRDNGSKKGAYKLYKAVSTHPVNKKCIGTTTNVSNTTTFPNTFEQTGSNVLSIASDDIPVLLIVTGGTITDYRIGETSILTYLNDIIKK